MNTKKIGFDIGNVLMGGDTDSSIFNENFLNAPSIPGMLNVVSESCKLFGPDCTHLVSKCGFKIAGRSRQWLERKSFYLRTGVNPKHVIFCRQRKDKALIATQLGLTHFVDDRLEILGYLYEVGLRNLYLFNADRREAEEHSRWLDKVTKVDSPDDLLAHITKAF